MSDIECLYNPNPLNKNQIFVFHPLFINNNSNINNKLYEIDNLKLCFI